MANKAKPHVAWFVCRVSDDKEYCIERFDRWKERHLPNNKVRLIEMKRLLTVKYEILDEDG